MIDRKFAAHLCSVIYGLMLVAPGVEARGAAPGAKLTITHPADRGSLPLTKPIAAEGGCSKDTKYVKISWNYRDPKRRIDKIIAFTGEIVPVNLKWSSGALVSAKSTDDDGSPTGVYYLRVIAYSVTGELGRAESVVRLRSRPGAPDTLAERSGLGRP